MSRSLAAGEPLLEQVRALFGQELEIERELGRGRMAAVFSALHPEMHRRVAVKALLPEVAQDPALAARFLREAQAATVLQHPGVVSVYFVNGNGVLSAVVMQYVHGRSLDVVLGGRTRLPLAVAGLLLYQVCAGVQHAHDRGIIHRDLRPANVLIDHDGRAAASDFGIPVFDITEHVLDGATSARAIGYRNPEQGAGDQATPAADQYAIGVMAFELFTGRLPFVGPPEEMARAHLLDAPPQIDELRPELPAAVASAVMRMMGKSPAARFPNLVAPARLFRALAPDERSTTMVLARMSRVSPAAGTRVVPSPSAELRAVATSGAAAIDELAEREEGRAKGAPAQPALRFLSTRRAGLVAAAILALLALATLAWAGMAAR